jgi:dihydrofolate synthase/folylpolyglutamate synthase
MRQVIMNSAKSIREHLFSLTNRGIKYDLDRIREAAARCGNPHLHYKSFHIAGTNGKGSTCTYIESVLRHAGYKTALYTSPHILSFEERFLINGSPVLETQWLEVYTAQSSIIEELNLTFFEATTLIAFELFKRNHVEWAVFETGLGGRLDATNIIIPEVSVITGIAIDHTDYLGPTLVSIANEKLGIVKNKCPLVFAKNSDTDVMNLAEEMCIKKDAPLRIVCDSDAQLIGDGENGLEFLWNNLKFRTSLPGSFQLRNALLALNALQCAGITDYKVLYDGLESAFLPGRFHKLTYGGKTIILDVGHNPDAASVLVAALKKKYYGKSICFVTGIMKDKDTSGILKQYRTVASYIVLTRPQTDRAALPENLLQQVEKDFVGQCEVCITVDDAVRLAFGRDEDIICITGSFYTVGEGFLSLGVDPYKFS